MHPKKLLWEAEAGASESEWRRLLRRQREGKWRLILVWRHPKLSHSHSSSDAAALAPLLATVHRGALQQHPRCDAAALVGECPDRDLLHHVGVALEASTLTRFFDVHRPTSKIRLRRHLVTAQETGTHAVVVAPGEEEEDQAAAAPRSLSSPIEAKARSGVVAWRALQDWLLLRSINHVHLHLPPIPIPDGDDDGAAAAPPPQGAAAAPPPPQGAAAPSPSRGGVDDYASLSSLITDYMASDSDEVRFSLQQAHRLDAVLDTSCRCLDAASCECITTSVADLVMRDLLHAGDWRSVDDATPLRHVRDGAAAAPGGRCCFAHPDYSVWLSVRSSRGVVAPAPPPPPPPPRNPHERSPTTTTARMRVPPPPSPSRQQGGYGKLAVLMTPGCLLWAPAAPGKWERCVSEASSGGRSSPPKADSSSVAHVQGDAEKQMLDAATFLLTDLLPLTNSTVPTSDDAQVYMACMDIEVDPPLEAEPLAHPPETLHDGVVRAAKALLWLRHLLSGACVDRCWSYASRTPTRRKGGGGRSQYALSSTRQEKERHRERKRPPNQLPNVFDPLRGSRKQPRRGGEARRRHQPVEGEPPQHQPVEVEPPQQHQEAAPSLATSELTEVELALGFQGEHLDEDDEDGALWRSLRGLASSPLLSDEEDPPPELDEEDINEVVRQLLGGGEEEAVDQGQAQEQDQVIAEGEVVVARRP